MGQKDQRLFDDVQERLNAANTGRAEALYDLGLLYSTEQSIGRDNIQAHKWFNLAAMRGVRRAELDRSELALDMSNRDIAEAQRQAREWLEKNS